MALSPIKDPSRYPADWPTIRAAILKRAELTPSIERCECLGQCAVSHQSVRGRCLEVNGRAPKSFGGKKVVLTIAHHPDPDPANCSEENLLALCQKCHLRLDAPMHQLNAARTRREKANVGQLEFDEVAV